MKHKHKKHQQDVLQHSSRLLMLCDRQKQHLNMEFFWFTNEPQKVSVPAKQEEMGNLKYCCCEHCAIKNLFLTREAFRLVQETVACLLGMLRAWHQPPLSRCWSPQTHTENQLQCNSRQVLPKICTSLLSHPPSQAQRSTLEESPQHLEGEAHQPGRKHSAPGHLILHKWKRFLSPCKEAKTNWVFPLTWEVEGKKSFLKEMVWKGRTEHWSLLG